MLNKLNTQLITLLTKIKDAGEEGLSVLETIQKDIDVLTVIFAKQMEMFASATDTTNVRYHLTSMGKIFLENLKSQESFIG